MEKFAALWQLFKVGNAVADPAAWKRGQITATALGAVVLAAVQLLKAFGVALPVDADSASAIAGGVIALVNVVLTLTTSKTVGIGAGAPVPDLRAAAPRAGAPDGSADAGGRD